MVASGPDVSIAEMEKEMHEEIARDLGETADASSTDLSHLLDEQSQRHLSVLRKAEEAAEILRQAVAVEVNAIVAFFGLECCDLC